MPLWIELSQQVNTSKHIQIVYNLHSYRIKINTDYDISLFTADIGMLNRSHLLHCLHESGINLYSDVPTAVCDNNYQFEILQPFSGGSISYHSQNILPKIEIWIKN